MSIHVHTDSHACSIWLSFPFPTSQVVLDTEEDRMHPDTRQLRKTFLLDKLSMLARERLRTKPKNRMQVL